MAAARNAPVKRNLMFLSESSSDENSDFSSDDSVKDKDYHPSSPSSSEDENTRNLVDPENEPIQQPVVQSNGDPVNRNVTRGPMISPEKRTPSRWRLKNVEGWKKEKEQKRRNLGHNYTTYKGNHKSPKKMGDPCHCKKKCRTLLKGKEAEIFNNFWELGSHDAQNSYLFGQIQAANKKRCYPKKTKRQRSARKFSVKYFLKINGQNTEVCKIEFLAVHGLQKSRKRVYNICRQIYEGDTTPKQDKRGRHNHHKKTVTEEMIKSVHDHIKAIPTYTSHYSRKKNANRVYVDSDLSVSSLYKDYYLPWCQERNIRPVKEDRYRRIFCTDYNIGFKLPKSDTCETCDSYHVALQSNKENEEACRAINIKLELHQRRAEGMEENLKIESREAKGNNDKEDISFDLQQAFPVPDLTVGKAFYLRKLGLHNLGIHHCNTDNAYMFTWTENVAKRGSEEICSIVKKYLETCLTMDGSKELVIFTDNCGGQNKNWTLMSYWLQLVRENKFTAIEHRFLVSGHTRLPSDRDFGIIENKKKYVKQVYHPNQWLEVIKDARKKNPFYVTRLDQSDFLSFEPLQNQINKKAVTEDKEPVNFSQVRCFRFESKQPNNMLIKHYLNETFKSVNIGKRGLSMSKLATLKDLQVKYTTSVEINENKKKNLKQLLPYIPPIYHQFYLDVGVKAQSTEELGIPEVENLDDDYE